MKERMKISTCFLDDEMEGTGEGSRDTGKIFLTVYNPPVDNVNNLCYNKFTM